MKEHKSPVTVLLVDDQVIMLDGLEAMLRNETDLRVVGKASNGREAVELARNLKPDLVLMDISMPEMDGIEATRELVKSFAKVRVLVLSMYNNRSFMRELIDAGAMGYVLKNTGIKELRQAIQAVVRGQRYFSSSIDGSSQMGSGADAPTDQAVFPVLTKREMQVVQQILLEKTTQEIADTLFLSTQTVDTHRRNIMHKLDVRNVAGLVKYAMSRGWYSDLPTKEDPVA